MEKPTFIDIDPEAIKAQIKADYENSTGRTLYPGQVEQLLINAFAYREYLLRAQIQDASTMNLVEFSRAPFLDYLGQLVGVTRLTASKAVCPLKLILVEGHGNLTIPKGLRVQSIDGKAVFGLNGNINIGEQENEAEANFTCLTPGKVGNGYEPGLIAVILDPQPYLLSAMNTETSTGGADGETDDELRGRIKLAPQSFSNAGSRGAYDFYARSANAGIIDVNIYSPVPGQVNIYPLMEGGGLPNQSVLDEVMATCNDEKIRPLTDTVVVEAPAAVNYNIKAELTLVTGSVAPSILSMVRDNLQKYADKRGNKIGLDIVKDRITAECMKVEGVYSVNLIDPLNTYVVDNNEVAKCNLLEVTVTGYSDE